MSQVKLYLFTLKVRGNQRRRRKFLGVLTSETRFSIGFLSNLTPNPEKFSAFGEIASLKKHYEKFTIKNTPPLYSDLGEYRGGFLIRGGFLNRNSPDIIMRIYSTAWVLEVLMMRRQQL